MSKHYKEQEEKNLGKNLGAEKENRKKEAHQGGIADSYKKEERGEFGKEREYKEDKKASEKEEKNSKWQ
jgi:hypothetical protein